MSAIIASYAADDLDVAPDPRQIAKQARLRYVADAEPGFGRRRYGKGFVHHDSAGRRLEDENHLNRITALVIPPAWQEVWICKHPNGHLQATGRDEKGRKQYRYHDRWSQATNWFKFSRLKAFGDELPKLRRTVRRDLSSADDRTRTLALMAALLDATAIRVGGREYAEENEHYGLSTLHDEHVTVRGDLIRFEFVGKSGKEREVELKDRMLAKHVRILLQRKGERLFEVRNDDGSFVAAEAEHLNAYLRSMIPAGCTAKTFRTWHGTVTAFQVLEAACECEPMSLSKAAERVNGHASGLTKKALEKTLREAVRTAAERLGNTTTVCKAYYIHPALCDLYAEATLPSHLRKLRTKQRRGLTPPELRLLALLDRVVRLRQ
ncbi:MAG: DNA topoisomerase IB [Planctomycetaceae bacterium]|nr:DNA topoisomerase IB [Planctomycetaceae bacterium]